MEDGNLFNFPEDEMFSYAESSAPEYLFERPQTEPEMSIEPFYFPGMHYSAPLSNHVDYYFNQLSAHDPTIPLHGMYPIQLPNFETTMGGGYPMMNLPNLLYAPVMPSANLQHAPYPKLQLPPLPRKSAPQSNKPRKDGKTGAQCHLCTDVPISFNRLNDLKRHIHSCHSDERPFVCEGCQKSFKRADVLKRHQMRLNTPCHSVLRSQAALLEGSSLDVPQTARYNPMSMSGPSSHFKR